MEENVKDAVFDQDLLSEENQGIAPRKGLLLVIQLQDLRVGGELF